MTIKNKIQRFLSKHKILTAFSALLLLVVTSLSMLYVWSWSRHGTRWGQALMYPSKRVFSPVCYFVSPSGWELTQSKNYDPNKGGRFAFMVRWLFEKADKFSEKDRIAVIAFFFRKDDDEAFFLSSPNGRFLQEMGALRTVREIDGKHIFFYHYQGPKFIELVKDGQNVVGQNLQYESINIGFYSDFGFGGMFWGLPENERDFWDVIESIQWKL